VSRHHLFDKRKKLVRNNHKKKGGKNKKANYFISRFNIQIKPSLIFKRAVSLVIERNKSWTIVPARASIRELSPLKVKTIFQLSETVAERIAGTSSGLRR
jgi:hypothetical protein